MDKGLHEKHRERLRKKFEEGSSLLEDHELLEILLFSIRPRINTNDIARQLIRRFGSLKGVLSADEEEIKSVNGVGDQTTAMIKLQYELLRRYNAEMLAPANLKLTPKNAGKYIVSFFEGYTKEHLIMFALDIDCKIINQAIIAIGTNRKIQVYIKDILKRAVEMNAVYVIISHNHPGGTLKASNNDIEFTIALEKALNFLDIRLIDHIVVANENYISIANFLNQDI